MESSSRSERRLLWLLAAIQLTLLLDFMVLMPLGPELMRELRVSAERFGVLVSCYTLASGAFGISGLFWLGRWERRRTLLALYAGFGLATLGCALAADATALLVARVLAGACAGLLWAVVMDVIVGSVPPERRGSAIGLVMSAYAVSAVAGVPVGLWIASLWGFRAPFALLTVASVGLWLVASRMLPKSEPGSRTAASAADALRQLLRTPALVGGWGLTFLVVSAGFLMIPYLGAFFVGSLGVPPEKLSLIYLAGGLVTFFTSRLVGNLVDRVGPARVLGGLLVASAVPHLLVTHLTQARWFEVAACFVLFMTLTSGRMIPTMVLLTSRVPPALRGRYLAVNSAVSDAASGSAAWLAGSLLTTEADGRLLGFGRIGLLAVGMSGLALLVLATLARAKPPAEELVDDGLSEGGAT